MHEPRRVQKKWMSTLSTLPVPSEITDLVNNIRLITQSYTSHFTILRGSSSLLRRPLVSLLSTGFTINDRFRIAQQVRLLPQGSGTRRKRAPPRRSNSITSSYSSMLEIIPLQIGTKTHLPSSGALNQTYKHSMNNIKLKDKGSESAAQFPLALRTEQSFRALEYVRELNHNTILHKITSSIDSAIKYSISNGHSRPNVLNRQVGPKLDINRASSYPFIRSAGLSFERHLLALFSKKPLPINELQLGKSSFTEWLTLAGANRAFSSTSFSISSPTVPQGWGIPSFHAPSTQIGMLARTLQTRLGQSALFGALSKFSNFSTFQFSPLENESPSRDLEATYWRESFARLNSIFNIAGGSPQFSSIFSSAAVEMAHSQSKLHSILSKRLNNSLSNLANHGLPFTTIKFDRKLPTPNRMQFENNSSHESMFRSDLTISSLPTRLRDYIKLPPLESTNNRSHWSHNLLGSFKTTWTFFNRIDTVLSRLITNAPQFNFYPNSSQSGIFSMANKFGFEQNMLSVTTKKLTNYSQNSAKEQLKQVDVKNLILEKLARVGSLSPSRTASDHTSAYNALSQSGIFSMANKFGFEQNMLSVTTKKLTNYSQNLYLYFKPFHWYPQNFTTLLSNSFRFIDKLATNVYKTRVPELTITSQKSAKMHMQQMTESRHLATSRSFKTQQRIHVNKLTVDGLSDNYDINSDQTSFESDLPWDNSRLEQPNITNLGVNTKYPGYLNDVRNESQQHQQQDSEIKLFQSQIERIFSEELIKYDSFHGNNLSARDFSTFDVGEAVSEKVLDDQLDEEMEIKTLKRKIEQLLEEELRRHGYSPW